MNKRLQSLFKLLAVMVCLSMALAACAPAVQPTPAAAEPAKPAAVEPAKPTEAPAPAKPTEAAAAGPCLVVGIFHVGSMSDAGYNQAHAEGVAEMKKNLPCIKLIEAENIPESAEATRVMENMIQQGAKFIIPASYGYMDPALEVAKKYPDVKFEHPSGYKLADNFGTYWGNTPDAFYLMGIAAGKMTKSGKLGFVGAVPVAVILDNLNAFHMGARSVNPKVTTTVVFTGGWLDPAKEASATNALADQGVDVVSMVVDSPITVVKTAEERGIYTVGYHYEGLGKFAPKGWIGGVAFQWGPLYTRFAKQVMDGTWKSESLNGGLDSDYMVLAPYGAAVTDEVKSLVEAKKKDILDGKFKVWAGPIKDNTGTVRIKEGEVLAGGALFAVDWLAEGVIGQTK